MSEQRLIDANALKKKAYIVERCAKGEYIGYGNVVDVEHIENAPTIDAVQVVRCGECTKRGTYSCPFVKTTIDGFCSRGKRREEAG